MDHDHILTDLRERFDAVLAEFGQVVIHAGIGGKRRWQTGQSNSGSSLSLWLGMRANKLLSQGTGKVHGADYGDALEGL